MLTRLTHSAIAFAVTVATYQAYVLVAVPFVEPAASAATTGVRAISEDELHALSSGLEKHRPLLAEYFPSDHWCRSPQVRPIVIENGQAMIVLDKYEQSASGVLTVPRVAVIFFPRTRDRGATDPPRDAIILEPERGAMLQMDQTLGSGFGAMGRMQYGQLLGAIRVRSDMREPGPQDDLAIETRDLYMNEDLIRTTETVVMRLGQNHARGRGLEIRFLRTESPSTGANPTLFGKLDTLEISHEVAALIVPKQAPLLGQAPQSSAETPAASAATPPPPAEIVSSGPFRVDFGDRVASFAEQVQVRQRHPDGKLDELRAALLTLYFAEMREWHGDSAAAPADASLIGSVKLEPATIEAAGTSESPVQLTAPSYDGMAVGERLTINLIGRQVTLDGGEEVSLAYRGAEVHALMVQYELPSRESPARLGAMRAIGAPGAGGWLRTAPNPERPGEVLEVHWSESMQLVRRQGQPVLVLDGRPRVDMPGLGTLWADQLDLYLRENPNGGKSVESAPAAGALPVAIEAERVVATGNVGIDSAELKVGVHELTMRIANPPPVAAPGAMLAGPSQQSGSAASLPQATAAPNPASLFNRNANAGPRRSYNIVGSTLQLDAVMRERRPVVTSIHVDGNVEFQESSPGVGGEAPLRILTEHLHLTEADSPNAKIEIRGGDARGGLAEISARGTVLHAPELLINRGMSHASIKSPGEIIMLLTRDPSGQPLAAPEQAAITWRESMQLDGNRITFVGNVQVQRGDVATQPGGDWLSTRKLVAVLTSPVTFDGAGADNREPEIAQLECWEDVVAEFDQRDATGALTGHNRIKVESLTVNQVTGLLAGDGPGRVDSIHFSKKSSAMLALPTTPGRPAEPPVIDPNAPPQLRHLSIDFVHSFEGHVHNRWIAVSGDVKTVYGPVDRWDQRLEMAPGGRPGPDTIWITCDRLKVAESPYGRMQMPVVDGRRPLGPLELSAEGGVEIEVEHPQKGAFDLRGDEAAYDQLKTMFTLKGRNRSLATITNQPYPGALPSEQTAESFTYFQNTGAVILGSPRGTMFQFDGPP